MTNRFTFSIDISAIREYIHVRTRVRDMLKNI